MPRTPVFIKNFGDSSNPSNTNIDVMPGLSDGQTDNNIWDSQRVGVVTGGILAIEKILLNTGSPKNILAVTSQINAARIGGYAADQLYKVGDSISATTLGGQPASYYWGGNIVQKTYDAEWIIPCTSAGDLSTYGKGGYVIPWTFASAYSKFAVPVSAGLYIGYFVSDSDPPGLYTGGEGGGGQYTITPSESGPTNNRAPYYAASGAGVYYNVSALTSLWKMIIRNTSIYRYRVRIQAIMHGL